MEMVGSSDLNRMAAGCENPCCCVLDILMCLEGQTIGYYNNPDMM